MIANSNILVHNTQTPLAAIPATQRLKLYAVVGGVRQSLPAILYIPSTQYTRAGVNVFLCIGSKDITASLIQFKR